MAPRNTTTTTTACIRARQQVTPTRTFNNVRSILKCASISRRFRGNYKLRVWFRIARNENTNTTDGRGKAASSKATPRAISVFLLIFLVCVLLRQSAA